MGYKRLDYLKRCKIQALWKAGFSQQKIADEVGVHKSTISRELKRNITFVRTRLGYWEYKADYAQSFAEQRKELLSNLVYGQNIIKPPFCQIVQQPVPHPQI